jgi:hypothetical protein
MLTLGASLSREVGDGFLICSGNSSRDILPNMRSSREIDGSPTPNERPLASTLLPRGVTTIGVELTGPQGGLGKVLGAIRLIRIRGAADVILTPLLTPLRAQHAETASNLQQRNWLR